jgi:hypothetical protein
VPNAPEDLPDALPDQPPTVDELRSLLDKWENVDRINDIRWITQSGEKRCEYMIFNTTNYRGFRVIWTDSDQFDHPSANHEQDWFINERSDTF